MDWVFDHLQILILIAVAVAAVLKKLKPAGSAAPGPARAAEDPEQAERTRRIQEEIRRRILERRGAASPPPLSVEPVPGPPTLMEAPPMIEEVRPVVLPPPDTGTGEPPAATPAAAGTAGLEAALSQLQQLEMARSARTAEATVTAFAVTEQSLGLPDRSSLRRAVVWREILGPPVGLR